MAPGAQACQRGGESRATYGSHATSASRPGVGIGSRGGRADGQRASELAAGIARGKSAKFACDTMRKSAIRKRPVAAPTRGCWHRNLPPASRA